MKTTLNGLLILAGVFTLVAGVIQACAGADTDPHYPGQSVNIWIPPEVELVHPGLTESFRVNIKRWCDNRDMCQASLAASPTPGVWTVEAGGTYPNLSKPSTLASVDYPRKRFYFYASQSDGDRIYLRPAGECRAHLPPGQVDAEIDVIVGHELGHALGMTHVNNVRDIMRPAAKCDDIRP